MNNFKQPGEVVTLTAPTGGVTSGVPVLVGGLLVVPTASIAETLPFEGRAEGVFSYTKIASQAWTEGLKIFWDTRAVGSGGQRFTSDPTQGPLVGNAVVAVGSGAGETTGVVRLNGNSSPLLEGGAEAAVADLVITAPATVGGATPTAGQVDTAIVQTAAPIIAKLNALLAALRLNGIIAP